MSFILFKGTLNPDSFSPLERAKKHKGATVQIIAGWNAIPMSSSGGNYHLLIDSPQYTWDSIKNIDIGFIHDIDILQEILHDHGILIPPRFWAIAQRKEETVFYEWEKSINQWLRYDKRTMNEIFGEKTNVRRLGTHR
jgi:hypothetical protein